LYCFAEPFSASIIRAAITLHNLNSL